MSGRIDKLKRRAGAVARRLRRTSTTGQGGVADRVIRAAGSPAPLPIGHRGNPATDPENSLASFRTAVKLGAKVIETDIRLSKDGVLFVSHDDNLTKRLGVPLVIAETNAAELDAVRLVNGEKLPRLEDVLKELGRRVVWNLHFKKKEAPERSAVRGRALLALLQRHGLMGQVILSYSSLGNSRLMHKMAPHLPQVTISHLGGVELIERVNKAPAYMRIVSIELRKADDEVRAAIHARGMKMAVYSARTPEAMDKVLPKRPDMIFVDDVSMARQRIARYQSTGASK
ncbi:MAG: glycerophosphodiester phosphodiesterase [Propionibacteriaceae bacterium]|nr:glycerophosphodiester phosphodiesterase [Propionibacteriaceae bacterium]